MPRSEPTLLYIERLYARVVYTLMSDVSCMSYILHVNFSDFSPQHQLRPKP